MIGSLSELRRFLARRDLIELLDQELARSGKPSKLRQAIDRVTDPTYRGGEACVLEGELGPWIEAFNAALTAERIPRGVALRVIVRDLRRPEATSALIALAGRPETNLRVAVFEALEALAPPATPELDEVLVRGASDSSAKVRTFALCMRSRVAGLGAAALAPGADASLLDELVALWSTTHQPEVADLIDDAAAQLPHEPIAMRSSAEREVEWQALAKTRNASVLSSLLATPWPAKWRDGYARLDALNRWSDPRIAAALRETMAAPPYDSQAAELFYLALVRIMTAIPDARQQGLVAAMPAALEKLGFATIDRATVGTRLARTLEATPPRPCNKEQEVLLARARSQLGSTAAVKRVTKRSEAELLTEIYANPDSDPARLVYADFLIERGDPRGELIALQCSPQRTDATIRRERALIKAHEAQLVGSLAPYIQKAGRELARGFLSACRCETRAFGRGIHEPAWATVHTIRFIHNAQLDLASFLADARSGSLRVLHGLDPDLAATLVSDRLEEIHYDVRGRAHATFPGLPKLRRLGLLVGLADRGAEEPLVAGPLWPRLERLAINDGYERISYWLSLLSASPSLQQIVLSQESYRPFLDEQEGWTLTLQPGPRPRITVELVGPSYTSPLEPLAALPSGSFELAIAPSRALAAAAPDVRDQLAALATTPPSARV